MNLHIPERLQLRNDEEGVVVLESIVVFIVLVISVMVLVIVLSNSIAHWSIGTFSDFGPRFWNQNLSGGIW